MATTTASALAASQPPPCSTSPALATTPAARAGISASTGMDWMSCASDKATVVWPVSVCAWCRSARACRAMAVDESDNPNPSTSAACQPAPNSQARPPMAAVHKAIWVLPHTKMGRRSRSTLAGSSSSPTRNSMSTTPNSAKPNTAAVSVISPRP